MRGWEIVACVAAIVLVVDQLSKALVLTFLAPGAPHAEVVIVPGFLRLYYVENTGAAFGLFQGKNPLLAFLAFGVVVALVVWFRELVRFWLGALALGLQLGGAVGNLIDRFRHGFVVDFIDFSFWPTFNLADSAITIGVLMLLYVLLRQGQLESPRAREAERIDAEQQIR
ncbi:signal peptidase II [Thermomicrobium roseum]|uniref:Lipoprotein signal peptidase n=1 Tax=Thermomicrobium roseum (strain ATCC 27502 / DSM 5159 / P-2) TaxID=309801 RepID=B9L029_THERP|nr:signal peptidase II [Thermomicrobium roseum]ACM06304.1 signal peptidase II [Thermomicrobium roseum DSM 5159]